jgi:predicted AAA+ superfamily ATPase
VAAERSGQFLDFSKLATKAKVNRSAARRFFELLEDTLICDRLDACDIEGADLVKHPKYFFFDVGVVNGVLQNFKASADRRGVLMEHLFFNQIKNVGYCLDKELEISHFRTKNGLEVDFVVKRGTRYFLIEVKSSSPAFSELGPLLKARKYFPPSTECFVACAKSDRKKIQGVRVLEWQQVIKEIYGI